MSALLVVLAALAAPSPIIISKGLSPTIAVSENFTTLSDTATLGYTTSSPWQYGITPRGNVFAFGPVGTRTLVPAVVANGIDITSDLTSTEGYEMASNVIGTSVNGAPMRPVIVGTDCAAYFRVKFSIGDADGSETAIIGWRKADTTQQVVTAYDTYAGLGWSTNADPVAVKILKELNGAGHSITDTTQTFTQATEIQFKALVGTDGVTSFQHDIVTPGTFAAPTVTTTLTFDAGDQIVPFFYYTHASPVANDMVIREWEVGCQ